MKLQRNTSDRLVYRRSAFLKITMKPREKYEAIFIAFHGSMERSLVSFRVYIKETTGNNIFRQNQNI